MTTQKAIITPMLSQIKPLFILALPLMLGEIVDASFNFIATMLSAHLGVQELAAGGLVTTLFITIMIFMWGVLISISPLISQRHGAKDHSGIARVLRDGLILATLLSIPAMLLIWNMAPILLFFGQKLITINMARQYLHTLTFAVLPDFWSVVLLQFVIGLGKTRLALLFNAIKVPISLILGYTFMFGKFTMPKLGIAGLGIGITVGMWIATLMLLLYIVFHSKLRRYLIMHSSTREHYLWEILRTGLPIAGMLCIEIGFFTAMSLIMGRIDSHVLAANQIVTQFVGFFTVIISFCYAQAVGIRVGYLLGKQDLSKVNAVTYAGLCMALSFMLIVAISYWIFPRYLISIDLDPHKINNHIIVNQASKFMMIAGFVQLFETARIVLFGALRGLGETHFSMGVSLFIFWIVAFPLGLIFTFTFGLGGIGMWLGMAIGTSCGAILLWWKLQKLNLIKCPKPH